MLVSTLRANHVVTQIESGSFRDHLDDAEIIALRSHTELTAHDIDRSPQLRLILKAGSGFDNIDVNAAEKRDIEVACTPGSSRAVAEHAITMLLSAWRETPFIARELKAGNWSAKYQRIGFNFENETLGLMGFGNIGRETAKLARALGFSVLVFDHNPRSPEKMEAAQAIGATFQDFDTVIEKSSAISLHLPLTPETFGMLGRSELQRLRRGTVLINTARAEILDRDALIEALQDGTLRSAALDVYHDEPLDPNDELLNMPNVFCTPHIGAQTHDAMRSIAELVIEKIDKFSSGSQQPYWHAGTTVYSDPTVPKLQNAKRLARK